MLTHLRFTYVNNQNSQMTSNNNHFSQNIIVFHERTASEEGSIVGYADLIGFFKLELSVDEFYKVSGTSSNPFYQKH
jgi:hypothetical protein